MFKLIYFVFSFLPIDPFRRVQVLSALAIAACVFALGFAYTAQYGFDLQPCILCLYQRWPFRIAAALGVLAWFLAHRKSAHATWPLYASAILFFMNSLIALFQVGVEQKWWKGTEGCYGPDLSSLSPDQVLATIGAAPFVRCDVIQFEFLGLSLAAYSGMFALGLGIALMLALTLKPAR